MQTEQMAELVDASAAVISGIATRLCVGSNPALFTRVSSLLFPIRCKNGGENDVLLTRDVNFFGDLEKSSQHMVENSITGLDREKRGSRLGVRTATSHLEVWA